MPKDPFQRGVELILQLAAMENPDGAEGDEIRDQLDGIWRVISEEQRALLQKLSAALPYTPTRH